MTLADWDILMILLWPYLSCTASTKKMKKKCVWCQTERVELMKKWQIYVIKVLQGTCISWKKQKSMRLLYFTPFLFITSNCVRTRLLSCKIAWGIYQNLESYTLRNSMVMIMGFLPDLLELFRNCVLSGESDKTIYCLYNINWNVTACASVNKKLYQTIHCCKAHAYELWYSHLFLKSRNMTFPFIKVV